MSGGLTLRFGGPRVPLAPRAQTHRLLEFLVQAMAALGPPFRLVTVELGVELADGRRKRVDFAGVPSLDPASLAERLRRWEDGSPAGWIACLHGLRARAQMLGWPASGPVLPDALEWLPALSAVTEAARLELRIADLEGRGRLTLDLEAAGAWLEQAMAAEVNRPRLTAGLEALGASFRLQRSQGRLPPPPGERRRQVTLPAGAALELRAEAGGRVAAQVGAGAPDEARAAARALACRVGDPLTHSLLGPLPQGPFSLPAAAAEALSPAATDPLSSPPPAAEGESP